MKPWIAKETAAKVSIMGSDYKSKLLEIIDPENLPAFLGGTCTCDGLGGCVKSNAGPWMHNRKRRCELWLNGERDTCAIKPGELERELVAEDAQREVAVVAGVADVCGVEEPVVAAAATAVAAAVVARTSPTRRNLSPSASESSADDTASLSTPSTSVHDDADSHHLDVPLGLPQEKRVELVVEHVYGQHPETRQVQTGDLHKDAPVQVVAH